MHGVARPVRTLLAGAKGQLAQLCAVLGIQTREAEIFDFMHLLLGPQAGREVTTQRFPSFVCDDHSPFEFSLCIDGRGTQLRVMMETIGEEPTLASTQAASVAMTATLAKRLKLPLARLRLIEDLFIADHPHGPFARWHALEFHRDRPPSVKLYLNPQIRDPSQGAAVIEEALSRLGLAHAWADVRRRARRGDDDEFKYFSLDLDDGPTARVKVYVRHHRLSCAELESYFAQTREYTPGAATDFCRAMLGPAERFDGKPVITCLAWADPSQPPKPTLHAPIAGYVADDAESRSRIVAFMTGKGLPTASYEGVLAALGPAATHPPSTPIQSYASVRWDAGGPRMTVYMSPNAYAEHATAEPTATPRIP